MSYKPKLEVRRYGEDEGIKSWAVFRADRPSPMIHGISKAHAEYILKICLKMIDLPEKITPIKDWYDHEEILSNEDIERLGVEKL